MATEEEEEKPKPKYYSLFRSETMLLCEFYIPSEVAYACIAKLGELELVEFHDLNDDLSTKERPYYVEVNLLSRAQSILDVLRADIQHGDIDVRDEDDDVPTPEPGDFLELVETFDKMNEELDAEKKFIQQLENDLQKAVELKHILTIAKNLLAQEQQKPSEFDKKTDKDAEEGKGGEEEEEEEKEEKKENEENEEKEGEEGGGETVKDDQIKADMRTMKINYVAGVIRREKFSAFELLVWRLCRGKAFVKFVHIDQAYTDPATNQPVYKTGFLAFFQGERMKERILKIADGFRAVTYPIPEDPQEYDKSLKTCIQQIKDLENVIKTADEQYKKLLRVCARNIQNWLVEVIKMKAVYTVMNNFKTHPHVGEGWLPEIDLDDIRDVLRKTAAERGAETEPVISVREEPNQEPPTYFKSDKFTFAFQVLIDSYGIATYKELNPMPYTVITFPFLFAMMFGDFGHGSVVFFLGLSMVLCEDKLLAKRSRNEIRNIIVGGRYVIMLLGLFSVYAGLIYNDCFAVSFNIFGSAWRINETYPYMRATPLITLNPTTDFLGDPYVIGLDPIWEDTENEIIFLNSFKMKISIIFGVLQMIFGLILNALNCSYFHQYVNIACEFLPMMLWMLCMFAYLSFLMVFKWIKYGPREPFPESPFCAPSVLITFIGMILQKDPVPPAGCPRWMYDNQHTVQIALVLIALICIPWLLIMKPICIVVQMKNRKKTQAKGASQESSNMSEVLIHQGIITIEYILGSISHTASYLRLWALSLAHSQLTDVLWSMVMGKCMSLSSGYEYIGGAFIFVVWLIWCILTLGILILMEGLSAFLHTLRLHWVEFQSKFYTGLGYEFRPFSFKKIVDAETA